MSIFTSISVGEFANDGTGDNLRTAFQKINANFSNVVAVGNLANVPFTFPSSVGSLDQVLTSYGNGTTFWGEETDNETIHYITANTSPVIDLSISSKIYITLTSNVFAVTVNNPSDGNEYLFIVNQGSAGGFSWPWPSNFLGAGNISISNLNADPYTYSSQQFLYASLDGNFYAINPLLTAST